MFIDHKISIKFTAMFLRIISIFSMTYVNDLCTVKYFKQIFYNFILLKKIIVLDSKITVRTNSYCNRLSIFKP